MTDAGRATTTIFLGVVSATTGVYAAVTVAPVLASDLTGSAFLAGLPTAALLAGAAGGSAAMARVIRDRGRKTALITSYVLGGVACTVAVLAVSRSWFPLFLVSMFGIGAGHAGNHLARYAAAELHAESRRPSVIGWMVLAQAVGAVTGPLLLGPAGRLVSLVDALPETGPFVAGLLFFALAATLHLRRARSAGAVQDEVAVTGEDGERTGAGGLWSRPMVRVAATALVTSQVVMLLVMTMTPVHARHGGHAIGTVGAIMSAHTLGMFLPAPLAGRLAGRLGSPPVILAGLTMLALSGLWAATVPARSHSLLGGALFLLGVGWCFTFVASSALLSSGVPSGERAALQARVEAITWSSGASASVASGLLLGWTSYALLCLLGAALVTAPLLVMARHRKAITTAGAAA